MQSVPLDPTDRKIHNLLQTEPGINASAIGERIGLSQSACWRRIQRLREEGVFNGGDELDGGQGQAGEDEDEPVGKGTND